MLIMKIISFTERKTLHTTSGIKHWSLSSYVSVLPSIKFRVVGQEISPQSTIFHTADR